MGPKLRYPAVLWSSVSQSCAILQYFSGLAADVVIRSLDGMPMDGSVLRVQRFSETVATSNGKCTPYCYDTGSTGIPCASIPV